MLAGTRIAAGLLGTQAMQVGHQPHATRPYRAASVPGRR
jgi:hypothetical protein